MILLFIIFQKLLHDFAAFFFVPLASQIVNDDSAKCRKQAALAMKHLISKVIIITDKCYPVSKQRGCNASVYLAFKSNAFADFNDPWKMH